MDKFYITTSIAYTNAPPHIGFALELVQADALARYNYLRGKDVYFLTGTDEHGAKIEKAAKENNLSPKEFTNKISEKFLELARVLEISNNDFIRTTDEKRHIPAVKKVWQIIKENGDIYKKKYRGLYCSGCEAFLTEKDLVDGKCPIHHIKPQVVEEENYFFRLSKYQEKIRELIEKEEIKIVPQERKNEILSFIKKGINDISFSRSKEKLKWGIPVPGDPDQVIYVWCDALVNYISALGYIDNSDNFQKFWPADVHCIGKDILRFHAIYWIAMLISLRLPLPKTILVHGFITSQGQKMSKSLGNVVDPFNLVNKYGSDAVRYYLLREIPTTKDGDFSYQKFERRYNDDLASGIGNLVARVVGIRRRLGVQDLKSRALTKNSKVKEEVEKTKEKYQKNFERYRLNDALAAVWDLISFCDKYIEQERLWEDKDENRGKIKEVMIVIEEIAKLLKPFLPITSEKILSQLKNQVIEPLFPRI